MNNKYDFFCKIVITLALLAMSTVANAANVLSVTGQNPFGFANQIVHVVGWTQTVTYSNVIITMPLEDNSTGGPISGVEGTVYLMNQIGPGTTATNEVAPPVSISGLTDSFTTRTLFSGLTLPAGNYYVVLDSTNSNPLSMSVQGVDNVVITPGVGVTELGSDVESFSPAPYPPATDMTLISPGNVVINVDGDLLTSVSTVPTMTEWGMLIFMVLAGIGAVYYIKRRRLEIN